MAAAAAAALVSAANPSSATDIGSDSFTPHALSASDVRLYREIFADEEAGRFVAAKSRLAEVSDRSLVGYVEAAHLLSPHARHITVKQLNAWLAGYDSLPVAKSIHELAEEKDAKLRRRKRVAIEALPVLHHRGGGYEDTDIPETLASDVARGAQPQIEAAIHAGQPQAAEATLNTLIAGGTAPGSDIAYLSHRVTASYMAEGQDDAAVRVASAVTGADRATQPLLDWDEGLADYRLGKFQDSAQHFEMLAQSGAVPNYTRSAAAFWAARAHLAAGDPLRVITLLTAATREQPTFYGLLAEKMLGQQSQTTFSEPVLDEQSFEAMAQIPAVHRAVALWQVGQTQYLAGEMDRALTAIDLKQGEAYAALAHRLDLPNLELRACETAASRGVMLTGLFPVPHYTPRSGYSLDPSLVLAFTRAESRFRPDAVSNKGARGLMQIMPATARFIVHGNGALHDPAVNLAVGQRYVTYLATHEAVDGDLIRLLASYNAGPAGFARWAGTIRDDGDPLLFIEAIPIDETRAFIPRVLTYTWIYAARLRLPSPSLDELAAGAWPRYHVPTALQQAAFRFH